MGDVIDLSNRQVLTFVPMPQPIRKPEDPEKVREEIRTGGWELNPEYKCRKCGSPPYLEQDGMRRWGCLTCGFTAIDPQIEFMDA